MSQSFPAALRIVNPVDDLVGGSNTLDGVNTAELPDGAVVQVSSNHKLYVLHKSSVAAQSIPNIIAPVAGPGRWYLLDNGATFFQQVSVNHAAIPPQSSVDSSATVNGVVNSNDIVVFNLTDTGLPPGVTISTVRVTGTNAALFRFANVTGATIAGATVTLRAAVLTGD